MSATNSQLQRISGLGILIMAEEFDRPDLIMDWRRVAAFVEFGTKFVTRDGSDFRTIRVAVQRMLQDAAPISTNSSLCVVNATLIAGSFKAYSNPLPREGGRRRPAGH